MRVYRIVAARFQQEAFSGEGARLYPARWHNRGTPMVYTAESIALAMLEMLVYLSSAKPLIENYVYLPADMDPLLIKKLKPADLPPDWRKIPYPARTREIGDYWVRSEASVALEVPSVVAPESRNYLINPVHPDFKKIRIGKPVTLKFDQRLRS